MSSFPNASFLHFQRETSHDPMASTHDCCTSTQRQGRAHPTVLCPRGAPPLSVLPQLARSDSRTGASALCPPSQKRRWPCPSFHAHLFQWSPLLLPACPQGRLAHPVAHSYAHRTSAPCRPQCGRGSTSPQGCPPLYNQVYCTTVSR